MHPQICRFCSCLDPQGNLRRGSVGEPMPSLFESVHLCTVPRQVAGLPEGLPAGGAGVGSDTGVGAHMCRQAAGRREGLAAGGAGVGTVAGMDAHVSRQVT